MRGAFNIVLHFIYPNKFEHAFLLHRPSLRYHILFNQSSSAGLMRGGGRISNSFMHIYIIIILHIKCNRVHRLADKIINNIQFPGLHNKRLYYHRLYWLFTNKNVVHLRVRASFT